MQARAEQWEGQDAGGEEPAEPAAGVGAAAGPQQGFGGGEGIDQLVRIAEDLKTDVTRAIDLLSQIADKIENVGAVGA